MKGHPIMPILVTKGLKTVNLDYHLSLLVTWVVIFWFKSLQSLTHVHSLSYKITNQFLL